MTRVEFAAPANITLANDRIFTVKAIIQVEGETENTHMLIENNANNIKKGVCSNMSCQTMLPGTEDLAYADDEGYVWFLTPRKSSGLTFDAAHLSELGQPTLCDHVDFFPFNPSAP